MHDINTKLCDTSEYCYLKVLRYLDVFLAGSLGFGVLLETGSLLDPVHQGPERQHALAVACPTLFDFSVVT